MHVTSLERVVGSVLSNTVGSAWLPVGTTPVVTCTLTIPEKLGHGSRSSNPFGPQVSKAPEVRAAGGDKILNVYFLPGFHPSPLLVFTFLRGRTQGKANAQK